MASRRKRTSVAVSAGSSEPMATTPRSRTAIEAPQAQMYGVYGPQYGGYLQASATNDVPGNYAGAFGAAAALREGTNAEANLYASALKRAQDMQVEAQKRDITAELETNVSDEDLDAMKQGVRGYKRVEVGPDGNARIVYDDTLSSLGNLAGLNERQTANMKDVFSAQGQLVKDTGYGLPPAQLGQKVRDWVTGETPEFGQMLSPADEQKALTEETPQEKYIRETAVAEINADAKSGVKIEDIYNEAGVPAGLKWTGDPDKILEKQAEWRARGLDPGTGRLTGKKPPPASPNAGAQGGGASATPAAATIPPGNLTDYRDPGYDAIENRMEREFGLPTGLMRRIRMHGERSNANQVSEDGARTVYQVTPGTRKLFMDKYGVDAYASPQDAARVAALHLRDDIQAGRDPVRGYIGGPDWSKRKGKDASDIASYAGRVNSAEARADANPKIADDVRMNRYRSMPNVQSVERNDKGQIVVTYVGGRTSVFERGRKVA